MVGGGRWLACLPGWRLEAGRRLAAVLVLACRRASARARGWRPLRSRPGRLASAPGGQRWTAARLANSAAGRACAVCGRGPILPAVIWAAAFGADLVGGEEGRGLRRRDLCACVISPGSLFI